MLAKQWIPKPPPTPEAQAALAAYPPVVAQLLFNRGISDAAAAERFLAGELEHSDDPAGLLGLPETVERLQRAIARKEAIVVYGDYDTDGVTATALLVQVLTALGGQARAYIPSRDDEGYGLNDEALHGLKGEGAGLVVTVDCGIRSLAEADTARRIGLDLIITDHHTPEAEVPRALAVINPKQVNDTYPEKNLAGVGLAFKVAQGLIRPLQPNAPITATDVLDLVALGTVADLAPLSGENRALVRNGLKVINRSLRREGLKSLIGVSRLKVGSIDAGGIGFGLGPRLNAAGRLESALAAYELMTTPDAFRATELAQQLEAQNRERQALTRDTHARAREIALAADAESPLLFAADESFRHGIVGLAAARLTDEFYRPAVVAVREPDFTRGSARSIREFHITEALDQCRDLLVKHGGHAAAAGFTTATANVEALADRLHAIAREQLGDQELRPTLSVDAEIDLSEATKELEQALRQFQPCGYGNPTPLLASRSVSVADVRPVGGEGRHLKLRLSDGKASWEAIAFNQGHWRDRLRAGSTIDVAYHLEINEWNGVQRLQLNVRDIQAAD